MGRSPMLLPSDLFSRDTFPGTADSSARDRKSTRLNSSHDQISYAVFCLKKKKFADAGLGGARARAQDGHSSRTLARRREPDFRSVGRELVTVAIRRFGSGHKSRVAPHGH